MRRSIFVIALVVFGQSATAAEPEALFQEKCALCHTIGKGDLVGPDLLPSTKYAEADLRVAVKRMEDHTGPLAAEEIDALVTYLASSGAAAPADAPPSPPLPQGSAAQGRALFFGEAPFAAGGSPCFACHAFGGRGGNLAADLTDIRSRTAQAGLVAVSEKPAFPLMRAAYARHPVSTEEAAHLAAFLAEPSPATPAHSETSVVYGSAAGLVVIVLAGVGIVFRRRTSIRSRLGSKSGGQV